MAQGADAGSVMPWQNAGAARRQIRGRGNYLAGLAAEQQVAAWYQARGYALAETRWRGSHGEIDLIFRRNGVVIFVEVKASRSHASAVTHLRPAQLSRIAATASEFLGGEPAGQLTEMRLDLAAVDGQGRVAVIQGLVPPE